MKFSLHKVKNQYLKYTDRFKVNRLKKKKKGLSNTYQSEKKGKIREDRIQTDKVINGRECQLVSLMYLFLYEYTETLWGAL